MSSMQKAARINLLTDVDISEVLHMTTGGGSQFEFKTASR